MFSCSNVANGPEDFLAARSPLRPQGAQGPAGAPSRADAPERAPVGRIPSAFPTSLDPQGRIAKAASATYASVGSLAGMRGGADSLWAPSQSSGLAQAGQLLSGDLAASISKERVIIELRPDPRVVSHYRGGAASSPLREMAQEARAGSLLPSTRANYGTLVRDFLLWCDVLQVPQQLRLPAHDEILTVFLASAAPLYTDYAKSLIPALEMWHEVQGVPWLLSEQQTRVLFRISKNLSLPRSGPRSGV